MGAGFVSENARIGAGSTIGIGSLVGWPVEGISAAPIKIGINSKIGCYCILEEGADIGDRVTIDHYVRVGNNTRVGADSYLLYGARIHRSVTIGARCRISGNCPDGTVIGNDVTHFGRIHHRYNNPWGGWEETDEPSPRIGDETIIAAGATIIGDVSIGKRCFIAAGEIVRRSIPPWCVVYKGEIIPAAEWRGSLTHNFFNYDGVGPLNAK